MGFLPGPPDRPLQRRAALRVYKFLPSNFGIDAIRSRRLKVALFNELNDPFEHRAVATNNPELRRVIDCIVKENKEKLALLCFSKAWSNPVIWSHYAASHTGLCLGFDISDDLAIEVEYIDDRISDRELVEALISGDLVSGMRAMDAITARKWRHWQYEQEVRVVLGIRSQPENGIFFQSFCDELVLRNVIIGCNCNISRDEISKALEEGGFLKGNVETFKARPAFNSFRIVKNQNPALWK
ncbi:DUF2971 domain-containing protein [Glycocaulis profundi]|nr:DUF2971 domain-containing protein [Glycocaulis profundi]